MINCSGSVKFRLARDRSTATPFGCAIGSPWGAARSRTCSRRLRSPSPMRRSACGAASSVPSSRKACTAEWVGLATSGMRMRLSSGPGGNATVCGLRWAKTAMAWLSWSRAVGTREPPSSCFASSCRTGRSPLRPTAKPCPLPRPRPGRCRPPADCQLPRLPGPVRRSGRRQRAALPGPPLPQRLHHRRIGESETPSLPFAPDIRAEIDRFVGTSLGYHIDFEAVETAVATFCSWPHAPRISAPPPTSPTAAAPSGHAPTATSRHASRAAIPRRSKPCSACSPSSAPIATAPLGTASATPSIPL